MQMGEGTGRGVRGGRKKKGGGPRDKGGRQKGEGAEDGGDEEGTIGRQRGRGTEAEGSIERGEADGDRGWGASTPTRQPKETRKGAPSLTPEPRGRDHRDIRRPTYQLT